jgi:hypothetical protein
MTQLEISAYQGIITHQGEKYTFRAACPQDAEELESMYASVAITKNNYRQKLNKGPDDFSQSGGMFLIHEKAGILAEMQSSRSLFGVIQKPEGQVAAMLWVSTEDPAFSAYRLENRETLMFAREIIVCHGNLPHLPSLMFYTVFAALESMGYTHSIGEVYKVLEYRDAGGEHPSNLINERSLQSIVKTGASLLGKNAIREVEVKSIPITARIEPQIVYFDYSRVIPTLEQKLKAEGVTVEFGEAKK